MKYSISTETVTDKNRKKNRFWKKSFAPKEDLIENGEYMKKINYDFFDSSAPTLSFDTTGT